MTSPFWRDGVPMWRLERIAWRAQWLVSAGARRAHRERLLDARDDRCTGQVLAYLLRRDSCCIDVGANIGKVLRLMLHYAPHGRHFAFEPLPHLATALRLRFPSAEVFELALSDTAGPAEFHHVLERPARSGLLRRRDLAARDRVERIQVRRARLDDVIPASAHIALVKIDVEGTELAVLEGARHTLARCGPHVIIEHGIVPRAAGVLGAAESPSEKLWRFFDGLGFAVFGIDGRGPLSEADFLAVREMWNFVAHPW